MFLLPWLVVFFRQESREGDGLPSLSFPKLDFHSSFFIWLVVFSILAWIDVVEGGVIEEGEVRETEKFYRMDIIVRWLCSLYVWLVFILSLSFFPFGGPF